MAGAGPLGAAWSAGGKGMDRGAGAAGERVGAVRPRRRIGPRRGSPFLGSGVELDRDGSESRLVVGVSSPIVVDSTGNGWAYVMLAGPLVIDLLSDSRPTGTKFTRCVGSA